MVAHLSHQYRICYDVPMRVLFMGSPQFALPILGALSQNHEVAAVFTQPDRKTGRGRKMQPPAVKVFATSHGLPVYQPRSLKEESAHELVRQISPDLIVVAAYGKILPEEILSIPPLGCINVHASLLPRWRGSAPIQAAILAGDLETGVSIMQMDSGLDTGPVYQQVTLQITPSETAGELSQRLASLGAITLINAIPEIRRGDLSARPQDEKLATYASLLRKKDGMLNFSQPAAFLARQVRAYEPWPSSFFYWKDTRIVVRGAQASSIEKYPSGMCLEINRLPAIAADPGILILTLLQPAGKRVMSGDTFLNGAKDFPHGRIAYQADGKI